MPPVTKGSPWAVFAFDDERQRGRASDARGDGGEDGCDGSAHGGLLHHAGVAMPATVAAMRTHGLISVKRQGLARHTPAF